MKDAAKIEKFLLQSNQDIKNFKLVGYERQVVNGFNHKLTYEGKPGQKRVVIVYEDSDGKLNILSDEKSQ